MESMSSSKRNWVKKREKKKEEKRQQDGEGSYFPVATNGGLRRKTQGLFREL